MAGYFAWNRATSFLMSGTHVQKVRLVLVFIAASIAAWVILLGAAVVAFVLAPPEQATSARAATMAVAARPTAGRFLNRCISIPTSLWV